jgi:hypothetical protein
LDTESLINDFAIRCFRNTADADYLLGRAAFRYNLVPQALWASLQTIEKYLKCIPAAQDSGEGDSSLLKQGPGYPFFFKKDCSKSYPS